MNLASLGSLRNNDVGSLVGNATQGVNSIKNNGRTNAAATTANQPSDSSQLSPLAQFFSTLQQVLQSNPGQYQQLTQLITTSLNQAAQQSGSAALANSLTQLASDFSNAANTGNLPAVSNLANAVGGGDSSASQQFQESSLSFQLTFSEISANNTAQDATPSSSSSNPVAGTTSANQAVQQQFQETSMSYELDVTQSSTSGTSPSAASTSAASPSGTSTSGTSPSTGASASGQLLESQQLAALIEQSLQNAATMAQSSGNSSEANLLGQLAQDITNALNADGQANPQVSTAPSSSSSQSALQQLQESSFSYQINFSEGSTNGITMNQAAFSLSGASNSISAVF